MNKTLLNQLKQIFSRTTWDGDTISPSDKHELIKLGYVDHYNGYSFITKKGVKYLYDNNMLNTNSKKGYIKEN